MFEKALVATDLSPAADHLMDCALQLRALGVRAVRLLHVEEARFTVGLDEALAEIDRPELLAQATRLEEQGYAVGIEMARGVPWYEIVEAARHSGSDVVILASHGRGALAESLLGGTAARVAEHAPVPVLVLRLGLMDERGGRYCSLRFASVLDHVLFPTDFSAAARRAFDAVLTLAPRARRITLLHVNEAFAGEHGTPELPAAFEEEDRSRLENRVEALRNAGCPDAAYEIARGNPRRLLLERARDEDVSLLVLGSRGWSSVGAVLLGSTAHTLVRHARAPVLLVRD